MTVVHFFLNKKSHYHLFSFLTTFLGFQQSAEDKDLLKFNTKQQPNTQVLYLLYDFRAKLPQQKSHQGNYFIFIFFKSFLETMDIGTRSELLSLLSFCMIYMANNGVLENHTYNLVGNDVKQIAILTWSCLSWLLLNKVICNFYLVSYLSF